jgi:hypothetical protein
VASLRGWIDRVLRSGEAIEPDPDEIVEAGVVSYPETAIVISEVERAGLRASAADLRAFGGEGGVQYSRIVCRSANVEAVRRIIDDVTTTR